jgi:hypothetical protein
MECTGYIWLRTGIVEDSCERGNEPSGSIKCWEIIEELNDLRLLKKGLTPWC